MYRQSGNYDEAANLIDYLVMPMEVSGFKNPHKGVG
jgi:hypothetical protein